PSRVETMPASTWSPKSSGASTTRSIPPSSASSRFRGESPPTSAVARAPGWRSSTFRKRVKWVMCEFSVPIRPMRNTAQFPSSSRVARDRFPLAGGSCAGCSLPPSSLKCNRLHVMTREPWILGEFLGSMRGATACWHCCRTERKSEGPVMAHPIGIGLLGLGSIGASHARALDALRDRAQVLAYSGGTPERAAEAGWPAAEQRLPEEVLRDDRVEVVALATPSALHATQALAALDAGKHVVVEKPLAMTAADADRVVERAEQQGLQVAVMAQRRLEPELAAVKEALEAGRLGAVRLAITHVNWWRDPSYYEAAAWRGEAGNGGSLLNQGVHNVDLLTWLAGPVESVTAQQATLA